MSDRVELTDAERGPFFKMLADYKRNWITTADALAAVESIVAAHVQALNDKLAQYPEMDELVDVARSHSTMRDEIPRLRAERDAARAELAAANARCAELEALVKDSMSDTAVARGKALDPIIENAALQATLDRISALADECEKVPPANAEMNAWQRAHAAFARSLRAALTPEGKP